MKIALCTQRFIPPFVGGVDVYADRLQRALRQLGNEVVVLAVDPTEDGSHADIRVIPDQYDTVNIHRIRVPFSSRSKEAFDLSYDPEMGKTIESILKLEQPDIFIIMNFYVTTLASVEAAKDLGIPVIHIATDFLPICRRATFIRWDGRTCTVGESMKSCSTCFVAHRALGRLASGIFNRLPEEILSKWAHNRASYPVTHPLGMMRPYLNQVALMKRRLELLAPLKESIDFVLVPTKYTQRMFLENGFSPHQIHYLPFGVEGKHPIKGVERTPSDRIRFLFIGRFQPYKGVHLLIDAFTHLRSPKGATLTVYGIPDGHDDYYSSLQEKMSANSRIKFGGKIAPDAIMSAFAESDFFVMPSLWHENSPLILLDALQFHTPVIASDIAGITDVVQDGVNGLLFPMGDKQALEQVLQRVVDEPSWCHVLRKGTSLPSIQDYARKVIELCHQRLGSPETIEARGFI